MRELTSNEKAFNESTSNEKTSNDNNTLYSNIQKALNTEYQ